MKKAAEQYFAENFGSEEKSGLANQRIVRISPTVSALQFTAPNDEAPPAKPAVFTSFFGGKGSCEFLFQGEGEITEILEVGATKYVFMRHERDDEEEKHTEDEVLTVTEHTVSPAHDQHGNAIFFGQTVQKRCEAMTGEATVWSRDATDGQRVTVRQRHTERDARCRVIEDSSAYRYYRLTAEFWELDEAQDENCCRPQLQSHSNPDYDRRRPEFPEETQKTQRPRLVSEE